MSNFSFATQQMLCWMSLDDDIMSECTCKYSESTGELAVTTKDSPCCTNETIELTNTNNLQTTNIELPKDITSFTPLYISPLNDFPNGSVLGYSSASIRDHAPRADIPILFSSLLI